MNRIVIIGRLGKSPELRTTTTGKNVASFSVCVDNRFDKENPTWFNAVAWGQTAEYVTNYLDKGRLVAIEGRMSCRKYTANDGTNREAWEIVCDSVQGLDRPREDAQPANEPKPKAMPADYEDPYDPFGPDA